MKEETIIKPISGWSMIVFLPTMIIGCGIAMMFMRHPIALVPAVFFMIALPGFFIVNPNQSVVLILFGKYQGTVKSNGFFWVNPFNRKRKISLRAHNFDNEPIKVNDKLGNPIMIGAVVVWRVKDTFKAAFDVNEYL